MNWEDERYVMVYTRDTGEWAMLSWDAQALMMQLLRKVDRAGVLQLGKPGRRALAAVLGHKDQAARIDPALDELLTDGCVQLRGDMLVIPNFLAAQEVRRSDKARQRDSRERRRAQAMESDVTSMSQNVTECHADMPACDNVTDSVTPILSYPNRSEPNLTKPTPCVRGLDPVATWQAMESAAGGPNGLGLTRKLGQAQPLWLDDNRALLWAQNFQALSKAEPAPTLAEWEWLGKWLGAGGADPIPPWQLLAKGGAAANIGAWLAKSAAWDGKSDPRQRGPTPRAPAKEPQLTSSKTSTVNEYTGPEGLRKLGIIVPEGALTDGKAARESDRGDDIPF